MTAIMAGLAVDRAICGMADHWVVFVVCGEIISSPVAVRSQVPTWTKQREKGRHGNELYAIVRAAFIIPIGGFRV